jgi:non-ribosomal peptide synthetase component F
MQWIVDNVRRNPLRQTVHCGQQDWSNQELWQESTTALLAARSVGAGPDSRIVLGMPPGAGWVAGLIGIWRAGGVAVLANVEHPPGRLRKIADAAEYVLTAGKPAELTWPGRLRRIVATSTASPAVWDAEPSAHAVVLHTSGTSGDPKPVLLDHAGLADRIARFQALYGITASDRIAQLAEP